MSVYPDASLLVSAYVEEAASGRAEAWLASLAAGQLVTSWWCDAEIASALAKKVRVGALAARDLAPTLRAVRTMLAGAARNVPVEQVHSRLAADLITRSLKPLRAGDALHLAIAMSAGAELVTLDNGMAEAGQALGLDTRLLA